MEQNVLNCVERLGCRLSRTFITLLQLNMLKLKLIKVLTHLFELLRFYGITLCASRHHRIGKQRKRRVEGIAARFLSCLSF